MVRSLERFVSFDLETTGLDAKVDDIIEIGAVRSENGMEVATFQSLVRTSKVLTPFIEALTGIHPAEVAEAPEARQVLEDFCAFCGSDPLVAHNAAFDQRFLRKALADTGLPALEQPFFDTLVGSRMVWPMQASHRLDSLVEMHSLQNEGDTAHRALADARMAGRLLCKVFAQLKVIAIESPETLRCLGWVLEGGESSWTSVLPFDGGPPPALPLSAIEEEFPRLGPARTPPAGVAGLCVQDLHRPVWGEAWEPRPAQVAMAEEVAAAFEDESFLAVEAGTGTGKSLAYLLPAARWAMAAKDRVVVSTATRTLQNQLIERELPRLQEVVGPELRVAVLKGRSNYICIRRLSDHLADPARLDAAERETILPILVWIGLTRTGDIEECHGFGKDRNAGLWAKLQSDSRAAIAPRHPLFRKCFHQKARRRAEAAHILVVNHALLLSDLALDFALLPTYERLVLDEAHHLPQVAHDHLGRDLSMARLRRILHALAEPSDRKSGLLGGLELAADLPLLAVPLLPALREELANSERRMQRLFQKIGEKAGKRGDDSKLRLREGLLADVGADPMAALGALEVALNHLVDLRQHLEDWARAEDAGWLGELTSSHSALSEFRRDLEVLSAPPSENDVHWIEDWGNPIRLRMRGSPRDPGGLLSQTLWPVLKTAVFTSATLGVRGRLEYFSQRTGLDRVQDKTMNATSHPSPFRLREQARVVVGGWVPRPGDKGHVDALAQAIVETVLPTRVRTLVLFTSERSLRETRERLVEICRTQGRLLLAQGVDGNRDALLQLFRRNEGAILLGNDSFWEGVDLPGKELELLVVARLPFPVPSDPLIAARGEEAEAEGQSAFSACFLPEAWLRLRQGIGRLLRRSDDRGAILVLDSRAVKERYGAFLADAWEGGHINAKTPEQAAQAFQEWFA